MGSPDYYGPTQLTILTERTNNSNTPQHPHSAALQVYCPLPPPPVTPWQLNDRPVKASTQVNNSDNTIITNESFINKQRRSI